jgi:hypothetical protein
MAQITAIIIIGSVLGIYFLTLMTIFIHDHLVLKNREKIDDEFEYLLVRIERYTSVVKGHPGQIMRLKQQYKITVNFTHYLMSEQMIYLFDRHYKLFAICDKTKQKTYLTNLTRTIAFIEHFEAQFRKKKTSGEVILRSLC